MTHAAVASSSRTWRDLIPAHPCADVFPMMSDTEIHELAKDIRVNGLRQPIVLWQAQADGPYFVLDGRNRFEALMRLGAEIPPTVSADDLVVTLYDHRFSLFATATRDVDPAAYVISANITRRHLTKEQQAELIVKTIEAAKPKAENDRATVARSFSPTAGKKGGSTKDPVLTKAVEEAKKHGISKRTVQNARARVQGKPKSPPPKKKTHMGVSSTPPSSEAIPLGTPKEMSPSQALGAMRQEIEKRCPPQLNARWQAYAAVVDAELRMVATYQRTIELLVQTAKRSVAANGPRRDRKAHYDLALQMIDKGYKTLAGALHPDRGGSHDGMARANAVRYLLRQFVSALRG
jgi:ParB-like nuclease family protein